MKGFRPFLFRKILEGQLWEIVIMSQLKAPGLNAEVSRFSSMHK